ncbi:MAG: hydantoinase/oxoprolinase family protein [Alphaproteobacteria bacterium]|nr:hydantoinase/oxoprolinase family protein [Alphaproteobacteria bacterium]
MPDTASAPRPIVGIDVGGTFTDFVLYNAAAESISVTKVPSTPANQAVGVLQGLNEIVTDLGALVRIDHGTTVSTNAVLERAGARVGLVTGRGFRDVLEIGRTRRMLPSVYDPQFVRPAPLVPRPLRFEVPERVDKDGVVLTPLDRRAVERVAKKLAHSKIEAVAVCFLHSFAHADHERDAAALIAALLPNVKVTASSDVVAEFREYERFSTAVINAYLLPVMERYLSDLEARLSGAGCGARVYTMSSVGGTMDLDTARTLPVRTILSGPAGGVAGAMWVASAAGIDNFITCDMGGTSTDVCLVEQGRPSTVNETGLMGFPIKGRQIDINTVGAGGGSIAFAETAQTLRVGPRSAGADPGPVCYGRGGTEPTVTDANVVLGRMSGRRLGGRIDLDREGARAAVAALASTLGIADITRMAQGIIQLAVAQMANAIREITIERGYDPAEFTLVAFGGAGPMHATDIAAELGIGEIVIPVLPGNLSALGLLTSDQTYEKIRTYLRRLSALDLGELKGLLRDHEADGRKELGDRGFAADAVAFRHALDMRYARQAFEITVDLPSAAVSLDALREAFFQTYDRHYGHVDREGEIEIVNMRTSVIGVTQKPRVPLAGAGAHGLAEARVAGRRMVAEGTEIDVPVYDRALLPADVAFSGPAIVEEDGATTVVTPNWLVRVDAIGNLRLSAAR